MKKPITFSLDQDVIDKINREANRVSDECDTYISKSEVAEGLIVHGLRELVNGTKFYYGRNQYLKKKPGTTESIETDWELKKGGLNETDN